MVDKQADLKYLGSSRIKSKAVKKCHRQVKLCLVSGQSNLEGNEIADELARLWTTMSTSEADTSILSAD